MNDAPLSPHSHANEDVGVPGRGRDDNQVVAPCHRAAKAFLHRPRVSSNLRAVETPGNSPIPAAHTHDGFFKAVFAQPEHATAFFKSHLPPEIVARIDWPSLVVLPGSFIKSSLQQVHADQGAYTRE